jgi:3-hydroxy-D-aspartate aldolase
VQAARHTRDLIEATGLPVPLVTGSGTGTLVHEAASGVYGELQAGSFLFMDADYARNERDPAQPAFEHALFVKTQVISVRDTHAVCDAGHKSHAIDSGLPTVALLPRGAPCATPTAATSMACCMPTAPRPGCPRWATCCGWCRGTATPR